VVRGAATGKNWRGAIEAPYINMRARGRHKDIFRTSSGDAGGGGERNPSKGGQTGKKKKRNRSREWLWDGHQRKSANDHWKNATNRRPDVKREGRRAAGKRKIVGLWKGSGRSPRSHVSRKVVGVTGAVRPMSGGWRPSTKRRQSTQDERESAVQGV